MHYISLRGSLLTGLRGDAADVLIPIQGVQDTLQDVVKSRERIAVGYSPKGQPGSAQSCYLVPDGQPL